MNELLTVRDVQDLLKIDRITVYRMLKDGRLTGVKIGAHWRFAPQEIDTLLTGVRIPADLALPADAASVLPLHCVQLIQDVVAEIAEVSVVITTPAGEPLTPVSRPCDFCQLLQTSDRGRQACRAIWRRIATDGPGPDGFVTCPAGLQCTGGPITVDGPPVGAVITGQFYTTAPDPREEATRVESLARTHHLDPGALRAAAWQVPVLDARKRAQIPGWVQSVAGTFAEMSRERAALVSRLRSIAALSSLDSTTF
jgi:excisionase family DNA binding protein